MWTTLILLAAWFGLNAAVVAIRLYVTADHTPCNGRSYVVPTPSASVLEIQ
jgi:hypothetical protein